MVNLRGVWVPQAVSQLGVLLATTGLSVGREKDANPPPAGQPAPRARYVGAWKARSTYRTVRADRLRTCYIVSTGFHMEVTVNRKRARDRSEQKAAIAALAETRRQSRLALIAIFVAVLLGVAAIVVTVWVAVDQRSQADYKVEASIRFGWMIRDGQGGVISNTGRRPKGSQDAILIDIRNTGGGGVEVESYEFGCVIASKCDTFRPFHYGGTSQSDLPKYLQPGSHMGLSFPLGCAHQIVGLDLHESAELVGRVTLANKSVEPAGSAEIEPLPDEFVAPCRRAFNQA